MLSSITRLGRLAFDWILPRECLGCSTTLAPSEHWCRKCHCTLEINAVTTDGGCRLVAPYRHAGPVRKAIHRLKYEDRSDYARRLVRAAFGRRPDAVEPGSVLVPVPLHPLRLVSRGYNQAALLARAIGDAWQLDVKFDLLHRSRDTKTQVGQSRAERLANLAGAFAVISKPGLDAALWLVDDVVTSGATLSSCRYALNTAGYSVSGIIAVSHASSDDFVAPTGQPNGDIGW
ncbi:MAG TPA: ComF family protein [Polyangiaceae bacterium]